MPHPWICAAGLLVAVVTTLELPANAQPGATGQYAPPPQQTQPLRLRFTDDELEILDRGHISSGEYVVGGLVGTYFGFGIGHAVQGTWNDKGWIFTFGEAASLTAMVVGIVSCSAQDSSTQDEHISWDNNDNCPLELVIGGAIAFGGLRLWEMVDLWVGPPMHNSKFRELQRRRQPPRYSIAVVPTGSGSGVATLALRF